MLTRRTVIYASRETTYGTDPAMTSSNALLVWDFDIDIKGEVLKREVIRDTLSNIPHVVGMKEVTLTFKAEVKGNGLSGTVPGNSDLRTLLSGCGFNTGVNTGTTVVQSLVSAETAMHSLSFYAHIDGNQHKILGARGTAKATLEAGKYGIVEFSFSGLYDPVSAVALPNLAGLGTNKPPICYNSSFQIAGFSPVCSSAEIDVANNIVRRDSLNATYGVQSFRITNRVPTLSFDADAVVESSNPFWGDWAGEVVDTFGIQIGSNAGNIVKFSGFFQYETNKYGDQDGVRKYDCKASLISSDVNTENDELTITYV